MNAVCKGLRPNINGCQPAMAFLITQCWDENPSSRPCLFSLVFSFLSFLFQLFVFHFTAFGTIIQAMNNVA